MEPRRTAWVALGVVVSLLASLGVVVWAVSATRTPSCGEGGVAALRSAVGQLSQKLPKLDVDPEMHVGDCWIDGNTYAYWSYPGLGAIQDDGQAAGCVLGDITRYESEPILSCPVGSGVVVLVSIDS